MLKVKRLQEQTKMKENKFTNNESTWTMSEKRRRFRLCSECAKFDDENIRFYECLIHIKVGPTKNTDHRPS